MATLTNRTRYCLGFSSLEFQVLIGPESSAEVPDDAARWWADKPVGRALVDQGAVLITYADAPTETTPMVGDVSDDPRALHWRKAIKMVEAINDLDRLAELHALETRKRVLTAIESRMDALREG